MGYDYFFRILIYFRSGGILPCHGSIEHPLLVEINFESCHYVHFLDIQWISLIIFEKNKHTFLIEFLFSIPKNKWSNLHLFLWDHRQSTRESLLLQCSFSLFDTTPQLQVYFFSLTADSHMKWAILRSTRSYITLLTRQLDSNGSIVRSNLMLTWHLQISRSISLLHRIAQQIKIYHPCPLITHFFQVLHRLTFLDLHNLRAECTPRLDLECV